MKRTYKIIPKSPEGLSYAKDIARNMGIKFEKILELLKERKAIDGDFKFDDSQLDSFLT